MGMFINFRSKLKAAWMSAAPLFYSTVSNGFAIAGFASISWGASLLHQAAGFICAGVSLILLGLWFDHKASGGDQ